jgi:hypothetical protein
MTTRISSRICCYSSAEKKLGISVLLLGRACLNYERDARIVVYGVL